MLLGFELISVTKTYIIAEMFRFLWLLWGTTFEKVTDDHSIHEWKSWQNLRFCDFRPLRDGLSKLSTKITKSSHLVGNVHLGNYQQTKFTRESPGNLLIGRRNASRLSKWPNILFKLDTVSTSIKCALIVHRRFQKKNHLVTVENHKISDFVRISIRGLSDYP